MNKKIIAIFFLLVIMVSIVFVYGYFKQPTTEEKPYDRERFQGYWANNFQDDPCKRDATCYRREFTENYEQRERELLEEYQRQHNQLPRCNDVIP